MDGTEGKVEVYRDTQSEWRWRRVARNGEIVADSGEGLKNRVDCIGIAKALFPDTPFDIEEDE